MAQDFVCVKWCEQIEQVTFMLMSFLFDEALADNLLGPHFRSNRNECQIISSFRILGILDKLDLFFFNEDLCESGVTNWITLVCKRNCNNVKKHWLSIIREI